MGGGAEFECRILLVVFFVVVVVLGTQRFVFCFVVVVFP